MGAFSTLAENLALGKSIALVFGEKSWGGLGYEEVVGWLEGIVSRPAMKTL